jgi:hypothetical protein
MSSDSLLPTIDEELRRRFEQAWREEAPLSLESCLPAVGHPLYLATLEELVILDMSWRARKEGVGEDRETVGGEFTARQYAFVEGNSSKTGYGRR